MVGNDTKVYQKREKKLVKYRKKYSKMKKQRLTIIIRN